MDARLHCVDLDTAYNQVGLFSYQRHIACGSVLSRPSTHSGGKEAGEGFDVNQGIAKLSERRGHSLPGSPRGAAAKHGRGASGDRDVLRVAARRHQANL